MTLDIGAALGPYEILSPLGAGGMGEVYRARDTRLDRDVAIKVLPSHLTNNPEFKLRFEREAKVISQLAHPNICTLHDIGRHDGVDFLVMECLEGETLAKRIEKGALPLDEVLRYGVEIASALDRAHRAGIVHRDLKPGNIILTRLGAKLLDFGLAKTAAVMEADPSAVTVTQPLTSKGMIVGTFQYMAPEQLEGKEADARTDIFALGAVLYEMTTGKRAFEGASRASLIASIMAVQPRPVSEFQPMSPKGLDRLIRKCLAKDPDARWQTSADVADELRWIAEGRSRTEEQVSPMRLPTKHRGWTWIALTSTLLLLCIFLTVRLVAQKPKKANMILSTIPAPEGASLAAGGDLAGPVAISPDGTALAFAALSDGMKQLWIRPLRAREAHAIPGTEGATFPFWSADSRSIGYFAREKLFTVSVSGGSPIPLCDAISGRGGTWNRDGIIVFSPAYRSGLFKVSAMGGTPSPVTTVNEKEHTSHRWPTFCPDGKQFLYLAVTHGKASSETNAVYLGSLDGGEPKLVMRSSVNAVMASKYLLYPRANSLLAAPFDVAAAKLLREPVVVATEVMYDVTVWRAGFSVSGEGTLAFHTGTVSGDITMVRYDRTGKELGKIGEPDNYGDIALSPDGKRIAVDIQGISTDIWVYDIARGIRTRLTFGNGANVAPVWSPDGQSLVYASIFLARPDAPHRIIRIPANGGDEEVLYTSTAKETWVSDWSADGKFLLLGKGKYIGGVPSDIWALPLEGDRKPFPVVVTSFRENFGRFSPDAQWIAYASDESGRDEVYLIPFRPSATDPSGETPTRGGKWQVSTQGGTRPEWRKDGKELFYVSDKGELTSVEVAITPQGVEFGTPTPLFAANQVAGIDPFAASSDGQWFIVNASTVSAASPINLIVNWDADLADP